MASIPCFIYLNFFPVKTNNLPTTLKYNLKNNLESLMRYFWMHWCIFCSHLVWIVSSGLSVNTGRNAPSREKENVTFKDVFSCLLLPDLGQSASLRNKHFTSTWEKNPHESSSWKTALVHKAAVSLPCPVTAISFFWTWAEPKCRRESVLMWHTAPLHTSLYFHDFPHVEMFGFPALLHIRSRC